MNHLHSHTHTSTITEHGALWPGGQAVNPWIRPFYECWTAEGWSLSPLSACIPTWLTAVCQNTRAVSGKLWIKVRHLDCNQTRTAELHSAFNRNRCLRQKRKKERAVVGNQYGGCFSFTLKRTNQWRRKLHYAHSVNEVIWSACMCYHTWAVPEEAPWCYQNIKGFIFWWEWKCAERLFLIFFMEYPTLLGALG